MNGHVFFIQISARTVSHKKVEPLLKVLVIAPRKISCMYLSPLKETLALD